MNDSDIIDAPVVAVRVYTQDMLYKVLFLGGIGAGSVLIAANYKHLFGTERKWSSLLTLALGVVGHIALLFFSVPLVCPIWLGIVLYIGSAGIPVLLYQKDQAQAVQQHLQQGGAEQSLWKVVGIGVLFLCLTILTFLGGAACKTYQEEERSRQFDRKVMTALSKQGERFVSSYFGEVEHEIAYDNQKIEEQVILDLGQHLERYGFFDNQQKIIYFAIEDLYNLKIIDDSARNLEPNIQQQYQALKQELMAYLETDQVVVILVKDPNLEEYARF